MFIPQKSKTKQTKKPRTSKSTCHYYVERIAAALHGCVVHSWYKDHKPKSWRKSGVLRA